MKNTFRKDMRKALSALGKHSPEILTGIGIAGMVTATVLAVRATPKALMLIEREKERLNEENGDGEASDVGSLSPKETVRVCWKSYIPATATGAASILCLIGASAVSMKQKAALATACALSETAFRDYREKAAEVVGEKKEQSIRDAVAKEKIEENPPGNCEIIPTKKGDTLCYDAVSGRYFKSDMEKIRRAENELNRRMMDEMYISLNDFYYEIGLPGISIGEGLGWNIDRGFMDLSFSSQLADDGTPCLAIDYLVSPRYDFRNG